MRRAIKQVDVVWANAFVVPDGTVASPSLDVTLLLLSTSKVAENGDVLLALLRCRLQKFHALVDAVPLLQKLRFVLINHGPIEFGDDYFFDGSHRDASLRLFLDSAFEKRG